MSLTSDIVLDFVQSKFFSCNSSFIFFGGTGHLFNLATVVEWASRKVLAAKNPIILETCNWVREKMRCTKMSTARDNQIVLAASYRLRVSDLELYQLPDNFLILLTKTWCRRPDSNRHGSPHTPLKRARLPIPPLRQSCYSLFRRFFWSSFSADLVLNWCIHDCIIFGHGLRYLHLCRLTDCDIRHY